VPGGGPERFERAHVRPLQFGGEAERIEQPDGAGILDLKIRELWVIPGVDRCRAINISGPRRTAVRGVRCIFGHNSIARSDRLARDVSRGNGAADDALTTDFFDLNAACFHVLVEASPGPVLERANLIDGEIPRCEAMLYRDGRLCFSGGSLRHLVLRHPLVNQ
jgi:hypothetical protein